MKYRLSTVIACVAAWAVPCLAQPTVIRSPQTGTSASVTFVSAGLWDVTRTNSQSASAAAFTIVGGATTDNIQDLRIVNSTTQNVHVRVRGPQANTKIATVSSIFRSGGTSGQVILEELRTSGNVGSISVNTINGSNIDGNLTGSITCLVRPGGGSSNMDNMDIGGDLLGDVDVSHGELLELTVGGKIGTSASNRVSIDSLKIANIIADEINADITGISSGTKGRVRRIETENGGDFNGSLSLREFHNDSGSGDPGLFILGDLNADVTFTKQLSSNGEIDITGDLAAGKTIEIFKHLTGPISIGSAGLKGQIIVNSGDVSGDWTGDVTIGTTVLSPEPAYTQTGLGGGAVGEVGFDCHFQDCDPTATSSTPGVLGSSTTSVAFEVTLIHYGPVIWDIDEMPFTIMFCSGGTCDSDIDVTDDFEITNTSGTRTVVIEPKSGSSAGSGEYHISPTNELNCDDTTANRPNVASYTYDLEYNIN